MKNIHEIYEGLLEYGKAYIANKTQAKGLLTIMGHNLKIGFNADTSEGYYIRQWDPKRYCNEVRELKKYIESL